MINRASFLLPSENRNRHTQLSSTVKWQIPHISDLIYSAFFSRPAPSPRFQIFIEIDEIIDQTGSYVNIFIESKRLSLVAAFELCYSEFFLFLLFSMSTGFNLWSFKFMWTSQKSQKTRQGNVIISWFFLLFLWIDASQVSVHFIIHIVYQFKYALRIGHLQGIVSQVSLLINTKVDKTSEKRKFISRKVITHIDVIYLLSIRLRHNIQTDHWCCTCFNLFNLSSKMIDCSMKRKVTFPFLVVHWIQHKFSYSSVICSFFHFQIDLFISIIEWLLTSFHLNCFIVNKHNRLRPSGFRKSMQMCASSDAGGWNSLVKNPLLNKEKLAAFLVRLVLW